MQEDQRNDVIPLQAAPSITTLNPSGGSSAGGNAVAISGTGLGTVTSVHFGSSNASFVILSGTMINATAPPGTGTVLVNVTSSAGTSNSLPYTYTSPAPTLTSLAPTSGPAAGGNTVLLGGTNLSGTTAVHFGAALAAFTVVSNTQISATAPPGTGTVQVNVTTPSGTSNSLPYTYVAGPVITTISPAQGPVSGGNTVSLTGSGFTGATAVIFGSTSATSFTVVDSAHLTVTAPGGNPPGPVQVVVATAAGVSNGVSYFYTSLPTVTAVSPNQGPTAGGNSVTVTGTGFTGVAAVGFGATPATSFTFVDDSHITAVAPAGSGTVQVTVTTAGGTSTPTTAGAYTYLAVPGVSSLVPNQGPVFGGNSVNLTGTDLTFATAVRFGATPAPFLVFSNTQIVAQAPFDGVGPVQVTVTTPGGTSPGITYTYVAPPGA